MSEHPQQPDDEMRDLPPQVRQLHRDLLDDGEAWHAPAQRLLAQMRSLEAAKRSPTQRGTMMRPTQTTPAVDAIPATSLQSPRHTRPHRPNIFIGGIVAVVLLAFLANVIFLAAKGQQMATEQSAEGAFGHAPGLLSDISMVAPNEGWALGYTPKTAHPLDTVTFYHYLNGTWTATYIRVSGLQLRDQFFHGAVSMASATSGWAICGNTYGDHFLRFQNGTWTQMESVPYEHAYQHLNVLSMQVKTDGTLLALTWYPGGNSAPQALERFNGKTWTAQVLPQTIEQFRIAGYSGFTMLSDTDGWFNAYGLTKDSANYENVILHWQQGKWSLIYHAAPVREQPSVGLSIITRTNTLQMFNATTGWALDNDNTTLYQDTGGIWHPIALPATHDVSTITAMRALGPQDIWLAGVRFPFYPVSGSTGVNAAHTQPLLLHYLNGQWQTMTLPPISEHEVVLGGISFPNPTEGWAAGFFQSLPSPTDATDAALLTSVPLLLRYQNGQWTVFHQGS